jgi:hypothetical protein
MAASSQRKPRSLEERARSLVRRRHKVKDPIVVRTADDTLRTTNQAIHLLQVASLSDANGPHYAIVLDEAGKEMDLAAINQRDGVQYFAGAAAAPPPPAPLAPVAGITVSPTENHLVLDQGEAHDETVTVTVPANAAIPQADVYFLADATASMGGILAAVQAGATNILAALTTTGLDLAYGVGNYKDFPDDPFCFQHQLNPTDVVADVTSAIGAWAASGGSDTPEGQLFALDRLAEPPGGTIGWRPGSKRILVWFGDAPGHDPVCAAISGATDITEASATAKLVAEQITVLAISVANPGLDADPRPISTDYVGACGAPGGAAGQATRIADATGGQAVGGINAATIVDTIIDLLKAAVSTINNLKLVPAGATAPFVTSITPAGGYGPLHTDKEHKLQFQVRFTGAVPCTDDEQVLTGSLDVVVDGVVVAHKAVEVKVPACKPAYSYSVKFICGSQPDRPCDCAPVRPGSYATEINLHNYHGVDVEVEKRVVPLVLAGAPSGREPRWAGPRATDITTLPPHSATMDDCCRIAELLLGAPTPSSTPLTIGLLEITSSQALSVTAVYTVSDPKSGRISIDVEQIHANTITKEQPS